MSKRRLDAIMNDAIEQEKEFIRNEYNVDPQYQHQSKKVSRTDYIERCGDTILSQGATFVGRNLKNVGQCSTSISSANQYAFESLDSANYDGPNCMSSVENICSISDKKGKKIVSTVDSATNTVKKTIDQRSYDVMSKGQAYFQHNRTGKFLIYVQVYFVINFDSLIYFITLYLNFFLLFFLIKILCIFLCSILQRLCGLRR